MTGKVSRAQQLMNWLIVSTFMTAYSHAVSRQLTLKRKKRNSHKNKTWVFFRRHTWLQTPPIPHFIKLDTVWLPHVLTGSFPATAPATCVTQALVTRCQELQRAWQSCSRCFLLEKGPSSFFLISWLFSFPLRVLLRRNLPAQAQCQKSPLFPWLLGQFLFEWDSDFSSLLCWWP